MAAALSALLLSGALLAGSTALEPGQQLGCWSVPDSPVFARLGDVVITQAELHARVQERVPAEHRLGYLSSPERIAELVQTQLLDRQLALKALEHGLNDDPDSAVQLYNRITRELAAMETRRHLADRELDSYRAQAQELAVVEPNLVQPEKHTVTFDQLLITPGEDDHRLQAAVRMAELYQRHQDGKSDFDDLLEHSDDPALADNHGRYQDISPEQLDQVVAAELEKLEPGEISAPFESRFGWHMLRLVEREFTELSDEERLARYEDIARERHLNSVQKNYMNRLINQPFEMAPNAVADLLALFGLDVPKSEQRAIEEQLPPQDIQ